MPSAAALPRSSEYSPMTTDAPSLANAVAIARPLPEPPPVTTATRPSSRPIPLHVLELGEPLQGAVALEDLVVGQPLQAARTEVLYAERAHDAAKDHRPTQRWAVLRGAL